MKWIICKNPHETRLMISNDTALCAECNVKRSYSFQRYLYFDAIPDRLCPLVDGVQRNRPCNADWFVRMDQHCWKCKWEQISWTFHVIIKPPQQRKFKLWSFNSKVISKSFYCNPSTDHDCNILVGRKCQVNSSELLCITIATQQDSWTVNMPHRPTNILFQCTCCFRRWLSSWWPNHSGLCGASSHLINDFGFSSSWP